MSNHSRYDVADFAGQKGNVQFRASIINGKLRQLLLQDRQFALQELPVPRGTFHTLFADKKHVAHIGIKKIKPTGIHVDGQQQNVLGRIMDLVKILRVRNNQISGI